MKELNKNLLISLSFFCIISCTKEVSHLGNIYFTSFTDKTPKSFIYKIENDSLTEIDLNESTISKFKIIKTDNKNVFAESESININLEFHKIDSLLINKSFEQKQSEIRGLYSKFQPDLFDLKNLNSVWYNNSDPFRDDFLENWIDFRNKDFARFFVSLKNIDKRISMLPNSEYQVNVLNDFACLTISSEEMYIISSLDQSQLKLLGFNSNRKKIIEYQLEKIKIDNSKIIKKNWIKTNDHNEYDLPYKLIFDKKKVKFYEKGSRVHFKSNEYQLSPSQLYIFIEDFPSPIEIIDNSNDSLMLKTQNSFSEIEKAIYKSTEQEF